MGCVLRLLVLMLVLLIASAGVQVIRDRVDWIDFTLSAPLGVGAAFTIKFTPHHDAPPVRESVADD